jgi:hypothetical protein
MSKCPHKLNYSQWTMLFHVFPRAFSFVVDNKLIQICTPISNGFEISMQVIIDGWKTQYNTIHSWKRLYHMD